MWRLADEAELRAIQKRLSRGGKVTTHTLDSVDIDKIHSNPKYGNRKTVVDGIRFDSVREAQRWQQLRLMEHAGEIEELERQVRFALRVNRQEICCYIADFTYRRKTNGHGFVVEDAKGPKTREYTIKKKLMKAIHGIEVQEI